MRVDPVPVASLARPLAVITVALIAVVISSQAGNVIAVLAALAVGLALAWVFRSDASALVLGLLPASALIASNLVGPQTQYLPLGVMIFALTIVAGPLILRRRLRLVAPRREVSALLLAYGVWVSIAAFGSIDRQLSAIYVVGIVVTIFTAFLILPAVLGTRGKREALLATLALVAVGCAVAGFALAATGPVGSSIRPLGVYMPVELVVLGAETGIVIPRITGIYETPGYQAIALALGLVALLATWPRVSALRIVLVILLGGALVLTMSRAGWLLAGIGCASVVAYGFTRRRPNVPALVMAVTFLGLLAGLSLTAIEVIGRYDVALARYGEIAQSLPGYDIATTDGAAGPGSGPGSGPGVEPGSDPGTTGSVEDPAPVVIRGGSQLGARFVLWAASVEAIASRPLIGYGPGTVSEAIAPFLTGDASAYGGLTSHNTWLRTGVELGIPGILILAALMTMLVLLLAVRLRRSSVTSALAPVVLLLGVATAMLFETLLFGGLGYPSFAWAIVAGLAVAETETTGTRSESRSDPRWPG